MPMVKMLDCLFEADRNQQPYSDGRDVDEELCPTMNLFVRWVNVQHRCRGLTRKRSATAAGSEPQLKWECFNHGKRGRAAGSRSLHRLVRLEGRHQVIEELLALLAPNALSINSAAIPNPSTSAIVALISSARSRYDGVRSTSSTSPRRASAFNCAKGRNKPVPLARIRAATPGWSFVIGIATSG